MLMCAVGCLGSGPEDPADDPTETVSQNSGGGFVCSNNVTCLQLCK